MKSILYPALLAVAFLFMGTACSGDDEKYTPGPEVAADCMAVYFQRSNASDYVLLPEDEKNITLTVSRKVTTKAASVPVVVNSKDAAFEIPSNVEFAEGAADAELTISFPSIESRKTCRFDIGFPEEYVDTYAALDGTGRFVASVLVAQWVDLGPITFTFTDSNGEAVHESVVSHIYQLEGQNNYRIENFLGSDTELSFYLGELDRDTKRRDFIPTSNFWGDVEDGWYFVDDDYEYIAWTLDNGATELEGSYVYGSAYSYVTELDSGYHSATLTCYLWTAGTATMPYVRFRWLDAE